MLELKEVAVKTSSWNVDWNCIIVNLSAVTRNAAGVDREQCDFVLSPLHRIPFIPIWRSFKQPPLHYFQLSDVPDLKRWLGATSISLVFDWPNVDLVGTVNGDSKSAESMQDRLNVANVKQSWTNLGPTHVQNVASTRTCKQNWPSGAKKNAAE